MFFVKKMATLIPHKIRKPRSPPTTYLGKFPKKHFFILPKTKRCKNWKWQYQRLCAKILYPYFWPRAPLVAKYVSLWPSASQPSVRWLLSKSIHYWFYFITYCFADLCISSSLPSRQKVGIVSEWNSSRSIFDIFKIHQNLNADINPWMMTCIWQRGNRRLAQIYTVARSCKSIPKKITTFGKWIYAEEIVKHSFLWMQLHQNFSDSIKEKLSNSDKTLRTSKRKFV